MDSLNSLQQQNAYPKTVLASQLSEFQDQQEQMNITDFQDITFDSVVENRTDTVLHQFYDHEQQPQQNVSVRNQERAECEHFTDFKTSETDQDSDSPLSDCRNDNTIHNTNESGANIKQTLDGGVENDQGESNDEDEFVALCTDASLVLNNDQSRRYYTNELYQPMKNSNQQVEDEDLLYQELRDIEAQEPHRGERGLTKILEDDEGDVDEDDPEHGHHEDAFDRLQLTNIIDAFEYPLSPLMDNCRSVSHDPLIGGVCDPQDKPDSTCHRTISPSSTHDSSQHCQVNTHMNNHYMPSTNHQEPHHHNQFDCNSQDDRESRFLSRLDSDRTNSIHHESHQQHLHQELTYNNQMCDQDNPSENSCLKQVELNFLSESTNESDNTSIKPLSTLSCFDNQRLLNSTLETNFCSKQQEGQETKRSSPEEIETDQMLLALPKGRKTSPKSTKNRGKRKRVAEDEQQVTKLNCNHINNKSTINNVASSMPNGVEQFMGGSGVADTSSNYESQQKRIASKGDEEDDMILDDDMSNADTASSSGGRRHPHMSKYRRRTANARERIRMREINQAFEKLKKVVPVELIQQTISGDESDHTSVSSRRGGNKLGSQQSDSQSVKLTKITTLRLAVSYIAKLSEVLNQHPEGSASTIIDRPPGPNTLTSAQSNTSGRAKISKLSERVSSTRKGRSRAVKIKSSATANEPKRDQVRTNNSSMTGSMKMIDNEPCKRIAIGSEVDSTLMAKHRESQACQQQAQPQPIMIASHNVLQQQSISNNFTSIQTQQLKQQQFAYAHCHQQPLNITQTSTVNGQERAFITPVAVAILGIPNQGSVDQPQTLQLLGIQGAQQLQQLQQRQHQQQRQLQPNSVCNVITQQPQQVTLTLDEINGLSVLRLNNPQNSISQNQQTIQLQPARTIMQQPQLMANGTNQTGGYNFAAYQPIHISQLQTSQGLATVRPMNGQVANTIHFGQHNNGPVSSDSNDTGSDAISSMIHQPQITANINHHQYNAAIIPSTAKTSTGTDSDFRNFGISPNIIAQHLSNNSNVQTIAHQIKFEQQSNCSGQIQLANSKLMAVTPAPQLFQPSTPLNAPGRGFVTNPTTNPTNLIYITPPTSLSHNNSSELTSTQTSNSHPRHQQQHSQHDEKKTCISSSVQIGITHKEQSNATNVSGANPNVHQFEQMKFVAQFNSQPNNNHQSQYQQPHDKLMHSNEANIRQLVATLTTSIHPSSGEQNKSCKLDENGGEQQQQQQQQQNQPKRTYRFHNYDGNMITNHLYNNNHDKHQQGNSNKRCQQHQAGQQQLVEQANGTHQIHPSQRSRQNSLSSTCSTLSSASSSLASLTSSSPTVPLIPIMIKSPSLENSSSSTSVAASD